MSKNILSDSGIELQTARKQVADYATALDCLAKITHYVSKKETIENILNLFKILFSPQTVFYLSLKEGQPEQIYSLAPLAEDELKIRERLSNFAKNYAWTESQKGFQVKIKYLGNDLGILEVDRIDLPENIDQYLNLAMSIIDVCGLSIVNARRYQKLKDTEKKLTRNEQRYKEAQRIGKIGNWEYDIGTKNFWGSDEAKRIYGFDSKKQAFTLDEVENCIPDRERVHNALMDMIEKGRPYNLEFEIHPVTGTDKKIIKSIAEVVKNESGTPIKIAGVIHDITARKIADENFRKSEEKYRQLFNSIRDCILVSDTDKNIIDCNQALLDGFGYKQKEIFGKKTRYLYASKKEYQKMGKRLKKHIDNAQFTYTINYKKKSGDVFPGETLVFYLKNDKEETVGFIGVIRDITYRKMVEESLQMSNDKLGQKTVALEDMNTALKILLQKRDQDNRELAENIFSNYQLMLTPFLNKLKNSASNDNQKNLIEIVDTNLNEIVSPFTKKMSDPMMNLTPTEIQIASLIKQGLSNKEIAQTLVCSKRTIDSHRENIRKKLNLKNKKINLKTFLLNF